MANRKKPITYETDGKINSFLKSCLKLRLKDEDRKELNKYLVRDNVNNILIVSVILMIISVVKCIFRVNDIWFSDSGLGMFFISLFYVFIWFFIKCGVIEGLNLQKYLYRVFWVVISLIGLRYLYLELQEYNSILNYVMILFLLTGFYISSLKNTILLIIFNTVIAIQMIMRYSRLDVNSMINMAIIMMVSMVSIVILYMKYCNYIKDKRARIALKKVGGVDTLTGLLNRRGFEEKLEEQWSIFRDGRKTVRVIMIDIDNFKNYNDTYGHVAGDQCLKDVTESIYDVAARMTDLVVRYGGEEIVIVLTDISEDECLELAQNMQERVNALNIKSGTHAFHPYITISIGIASMYVTNNNTIYDIIDKADEQLYYSKNSGRNRITMNSISVELSKIMVANS